jgi:peptidoglycan hydrolase CwlO-like protein
MTVTMTMDEYNELKSYQFKVSSRNDELQNLQGKYSEQARLCNWLQSENKRLNAEIVELNNQLAKETFEYEVIEKETFGHRGTE